jgi:hypothetical protein
MSIGFRGSIIAHLPLTKNLIAHHSQIPIPRSPAAASWQLKTLFSRRWALPYLNAVEALESVV